MIKLIALDRDGVINQDSPLYIRSPEELLIIPESLQALAKLKEYGLLAVVVTNQSGVARGYFSLETLHAIHHKMLHCIDDAGGEIAAIFFCPHAPVDDCTCRKPKSGLLLQAARQFEVLPEEILMVGDSWRDMLAARSCGAQTAFIQTPEKVEDLRRVQQAQIKVYPNLLAVVQDIFGK